MVGMGRFVVMRHPVARVVVVPAVVALVVGLIAAERWFGASSGWFAFVVVWWPMAWVGTMSRLVQLRLPERYHALRRFEDGGRVYERLGVGAAKAVLKRPPFAWFNPGLHLPRERTPVELERLAQRMRDAEASHALLFVLTFCVVAHALARGWWLAAGLTLLFDVVMNGYPVMLQRHNRARLAARYHLIWS
jgi:hypothetical protein